MFHIKTVHNIPASAALRAWIQLNRATTQDHDSLAQRLEFPRTTRSSGAGWQFGAQQTTTNTLISTTSQLLFDLSNLKLRNWKKNSSVEEIPPPHSSTTLPSCGVVGPRVNSPELQRSHLLCAVTYIFAKISSCVAIIRVRWITIFKICQRLAFRNFRKFVTFIVKNRLLLSSFTQAVVLFGFFFSFSLSHLLVWFMQLVT